MAALPAAPWARRGRPRAVGRALRRHGEQPPLAVGGDEPVAVVGGLRHERPVGHRARAEYRRPAAAWPSSPPRCRGGAARRPPSASGTARCTRRRRRAARSLPPASSIRPLRSCQSWASCSRPPGTRPVLSAFATMYGEKIAERSEEGAAAAVTRRPARLPKHRRAEPAHALEHPRRAQAAEHAGHRGGHDQVALVAGEPASVITATSTNQARPSAAERQRHALLARGGGPTATAATAEGDERPELHRRDHDLAEAVDELERRDARRTRRCPGWGCSRARRRGTGRPSPTTRAGTRAPARAPRTRPAAGAARGSANHSQSP